MIETLALVAVLVQTAPDVPRFKYVLPDGFSGWVCVDFGVDGAGALPRDPDGTYLIEVPANGRLRTSTLPNFHEGPFPERIVRRIDGEERSIDMTEMRHRSEYDTGSPVSRHCLFVGNAADAAAAPRPPTLAESRLGTDPILPRFEFQRGALCDFHEALPVCLEATDLGKRGIETTILAALADPRVHPARSCDAFHGIVARYQTNRSVSTHSSVLGDRFGFGEVRRERAGTGTLALAVWIDTGGGGADAIATRFARDLKEFLERAASASCGRRP